MNDIGPDLEAGIPDYEDQVEYWSRMEMDDEAAVYLRLMDQMEDEDAADELAARAEHFRDMKEDR